MAELFDKDRRTITRHIQNIYRDGELETTEIALFNTFRKCFELFIVYTSKMYIYKQLAYYLLIIINNRPHIFILLSTIFTKKRRVSFQLTLLRYFSTNLMTLRLSSFF